MFSLFSSSVTTGTHQAGEWTDSFACGNNNTNKSESVEPAFNPLLDSPEAIDLGEALFMSSGSGLRLSPLLVGSSVPQQMATAATSLSATTTSLVSSPPAKLLPAGEFFITEWIEQGENVTSAHPNIPVCFRIVRQENFRPAVRVVGTESNTTYCWLMPSQCNLMIPLLESETARIDGKWMRAGSAAGVRLALLVRVSIDQSRLDAAGRVQPKSQVEAAAWSSLASLTRTSLFFSTPVPSTSQSGNTVSGPVASVTAAETEGENSNEIRKLLEDASAAGRGNMLEVSPIEPSANLTCTLHGYQKQGLAWMVARESGANGSSLGAEKRHKNASSFLPPGWEEKADPVSGKPYFVNLATGTAYTQHPGMRSDSEAASERATEGASCCGGILSDDMGMGKTMQVIALLLHSKATGPTLIVCPLSVLSQWESELRRRVAPGTLKVVVFHGPNRATSVSELQSCDVVLTTYATLSLEGNEAADRSSKKRQRPKQLVLEMEWYRVVLDEAHQIKDRSTKTAKSCFQIKATRRWAVTGTPVQNKLDEIQSLLMFIKAEPYDSVSWFQQFVMRPIKNGDNRGYDRLRSVLSNVMLRRTKQDNDSNGHRLVELPERVVKVEKLVFSEAERAIYDRLWNGTRSRLSDMIGAGDTIADGFSHVLVMLLRLRQCCDHPALLKQASMAEEDDCAAVCGKCQQETATMQTPCRHLFCSGCLEDALKSPSGCPLCTRPISALQCRAAISNPLAAAANLPQLPPVDVSAIRSTKIEALMAHLLRIRAEDPSVKSVVFSQWTSMLALIETALIKSKMRFVRLDGSMSQAARNAAIELFQTDDSVSIFLISTKAGGQGLNLARASRAFLMDPWWCSGTEFQAIDRIHRIGQIRPVEVTRFVMADSIEESMLTLQASKNELADRVVTSAPSAPNASDILKLFGLNHGKLMI